MYEVYIWQLGLRLGLDSIADIDKEINLSVKFRPPWHRLH
jgi:hypothetical protein